MNILDNQLNPDQILAADAINTFIKTPSLEDNIFLLTGGPGTGKTYMLADVISKYPKSIQAATISHAAKNILQYSIGPKVNCVTIAKLLGLRANITDDGEREFIRTDSTEQIFPSQVGFSKLLIIDEVSQISDPVYDMLTREAIAREVKIIAVGDPYQLPPVAQNHDSKFFNHVGANLTISMRFQGPIADIAEIYKNQIDCINKESGFNKWALNQYTRRKSNLIDDTGYVFVNNLNRLMDIASDDIKTHPGSISHARVLAFKNESVKEINNLIRFRLYGKHLAQFEPNEIVICNGGFCAYSSFEGIRSRNKTSILYNGQLLIVDSYCNSIGPEGVPCVLMKFKNFSNTNGIPIYTVSDTDEGRLAYNKIKTKLFQEAKRPQKNVSLTSDAWARYYSFIDSFAYFDYAYAVNAYKSQGQTIDNVYVCEGEMMGIQPLTWKQKFQALYVAMTRAKEKLYIYNKEF